MKFNDLYDRVFVSEQENVEVAHPKDFEGDVKGAPTPNPGVPPATGDQGGQNLQDYKGQVQEFINKLTEPGGNSLLALVGSLDRKNTPFEGISTKIRSNIAQAAKSLGDIIVDIDVCLNNIASNPNNPNVG